MQVTRRIGREAREPYVYSHDELVSRVQAINPDNSLQYLRVGVTKVPRYGAGGLILRLVKVLLAKQADPLVAIKVHVAVVARLTAEIDGTSAHVQHLAVANRLLAVVPGVEVVGQDDRLVGV